MIMKQEKIMAAIYELSSSAGYGWIIVNFEFSSTNKLQLNYKTQLETLYFKTNTSQ